nr:zeatin O-glucosyltransferase-like [Ipomoea batatas]
MGEQSSQNGGIGAEVVVVMVPLPAQGHLNQLLHLSRLISSYNIPVYYTGAATHLRQAKLRLQGWDPLSLSNLHFHEFPTPSFQSPDPHTKTKSPSQLAPSFHAAMLLRDPLRDFLSNLSRNTRRVVVIYDYLMSWNVQDIPSIPNAESYAFHSASAFSMYSFIWEIMQKPPLPPEAQVLKDLPNLDACMPPELVEYGKLQNQALMFNSGALFNSCRMVEGAFLDLLAKEPILRASQQWAIGPFNPVILPENKDSGMRHKCLAWLDKQEQNSVIFVSFGSSTSLSEEQINEIAIGLAESEQKFIWSKIPELKMAGGIGHGGGPGVEVAVVMVPLPAQGHLNQLLHLSRLLSSYKIPVYYTGAATHIRQAKLRLHGWDPHSLSKLLFHEFPTPSFQSPPPNPDIRYPTQLLPAFHAALLLRDPLREFLSDLSKETRRVVVIYDNMMSWNVQDIPSIPNAECYAFISVSAFSIYSFIWEIMQKPPLPPEAQSVKDLPNLEACMAPEFWEFNKIQQQALRFDSGILYNTCRVIEGAFLDLVAKEPIIRTGQQWAIGPFNPVTLPENQDSGVRHKCLACLDNQERNSVIFVSFGSTTALSEEQINEIAIGLAESEQKFILVLREADKGDVFVGEARRAELPEGYEEGIKGKGIVVRDWAPQLEILAHSSTGGFMSHCGWNSCMEGISMGVPIAAWPMHSDQPRNAMLITKVLKMGVEVDDCSSREMVRSQRIADGVKRLMGSREGDEMRRRAEELSRKVKVSVMDGGAARMEMDSFISHITRE